MNNRIIITSKNKHKFFFMISSDGKFMHKFQCSNYDDPNMKFSENVYVLSHKAYAIEVSDEIFNAIDFDLNNIIIYDVIQKFKKLKSLL